MSKRKLPVHYPSVPDVESAPARHNEPEMQKAADRMPVSSLRQDGESRAELRLRIEQLLRYREDIPEGAIAALGEAGRAMMVDLLEDEAIRSQPALFHRLIATLGLNGVKRAVAPLSAILQRGAEENLTKAYAANALGRIGEPGAVEALGAVVTAQDSMVRRQAAIALGRLERLESVPHLARLQRDGSAAVAEAAAAGLRRIEDRYGKKVGARVKPPAERKPGKKIAPKVED